MTVRHRVGRLAAAAALLAALAAPGGTGAQADDDRPLSPAQIALFESNHLKSIAQPVALEYSFHHQGGSAGDFTDRVTAEIRAVHDDGRKDVWVEFLTGARKIDFPPSLGFNGNPLLMYFLEHDVVEMHHATGGSAAYFRNRIRVAFVDQAEVHPVELDLDGKQLSGTEITLAPFRNDPELERFPGLAGKTYRFTLSDSVPGTIYQMATAVPGGTGNPPPDEETMTYVGEHP